MVEFGIEKCPIIIIKRVTRETKKGIEVPNQERFRTLGEKEN